MVDEVNSTKAIVQIDYGDGFFTTIGQIELTNSSSSAPIDISNKSYDDYIALMDGELSSRQYSLTGNIFYNSDTSYRKIRELALLGTEFRTKILELSDDPEDFIYWTVISSMSDQLNVGEGIATSVTFLNRDFIQDFLIGGDLLTIPEAGNKSFDYQYSDEPVRGVLSDPLFVQGLGEAPSTVKRILLRFIQRPDSDFDDCIFQLTLEPEEQQRPIAVNVTIGTAKFRAEIETSYAGVNYPDESFSSGYRCEAKGFSLQNPLNNSFKVWQAYDFWLDNVLNNGGAAFPFKVEEIKGPRVIIESTLTPDINPLDVNEVGFLREQYGSLSLNYWDQFKGSIENATLGKEETITIRADNSGNVLIETTVNANDVYYREIDLIIDQKVYNLQRLNTTFSKFLGGSYVSTSVSSGLEIYNIFNQLNPVNFKVIQRPLTRYIGEITLDQSVLGNEIIISFSSYQADSSIGTINNYNGAVNDFKITINNILEQAEVLLNDDQPNELRPLLREITLNNEKTIVTSLPDNNSDIATNNDYLEVLDFFNYASQFIGQTIPFRVNLQDTPWINPLEQ